MKRNILFLCVLISSTLCSCSFLNTETEQVAQEDVTVFMQNKSQLSDETIEYLSRDQAELYNYSMLEKKLQDIYVEIHYVISHMETDYTLTYCEPALIDKVFTCVLNDHPEIFWCEGYSYSLNERKGEKYVLFSGTYSKSKEEVASMKEKINEVVNPIIAAAPEGEYERVKYVYEYLIHNTIYDTTAMESQNIISVLLYQHSVCQGYAKTIQYLLQLLNVDATIVNGTVYNDVPHAWNLININGNYYWMDATWGDSSYKIANYQQYGIEPKIDYYYLSMTTNQLLMDHKLDYLVPYPECDSNEDNYFVKEGLYFYEVDYEKMNSIVNLAKERGESAVVFQCEDVNCYKNMYTALVIEKGIFNVIQSPDILYETSDKKLNITIWF